MLHIIKRSNKNTKHSMSVQQAHFKSVPLFYVNATFNTRLVQVEGIKIKSYILHPAVNRHNLNPLLTFNQCKCSEKHWIRWNHIISMLILSHNPENVITQHLVLTEMAVIPATLNKSHSSIIKVPKTPCFPSRREPHLHLVSENIDIINIAARY